MREKRNKKIEKRNKTGNKRKQQGTRKRKERILSLLENYVEARVFAAQKMRLWKVREKETREISVSIKGKKEKEGWEK